MSKIRSLYSIILQKKGDTLPLAPKGYVRAHTIVGKDVIQTRLFRLSGAKHVMDKDGVGKVSIFVQDGINYVYSHEKNFYTFAGKASEKPLETVINAVNNISASYMNDYADKINDLAKPYVGIIPRDVVKQIKDLTGNLNEMPKQKFVALVSAKDGIVTVKNFNTTIVSSKKIDVPDFENKDVLSFRRIKNEIYIDEDNRYTDGVGGSIAGLGYDSMKTIDQTNTELEINVTPGVLKVIKKAQRSVDKNNPKFELNGILIDVENGKAKAVGTNTRRLTVSKEFDVSGKDGQYIIYPNQIGKDTKIIKIGKSSNGDETTYSKTSEYEIYTKNIRGRYPDYERIVPAVNKVSMTMDSKELQKLLKGQKEAVFTIHSDRIVVSKMEEYGDALEAGEMIGTIETSKTTAKGEVFGFNTKYVLDAIKDEYEITLNFNEPGRPFTVKSDDQLTIIMPIVLVSRDEVRKQKEEREERQRQREAEHIAFEKAREAKELEEKIAEEGVAYDFLNTLEPKRRGQAKKVLLKQIRSDGKIMDRKDWVKAVIEKGYKPKYAKWNDYKTGKPKEGWELSAENSAYDVTKTEAQFAQFLIDGTTLDSIDTSIEEDDRKAVEAIIEGSEYIRSTISKKEMVDRLSGITREEYKKLHKIERLNILNRLFDMVDGCKYWSDEDNDYSYRCKNGIETLHVPEHKVFAFIIEKVSSGDVVADSAEESILKPNKPVKVGDIAITIESEKGTMRRGIGHTGEEWATELKDDYGYFDLTTGADEVQRAYSQELQSINQVKINDAIETLSRENKKITVSSISRVSGLSRNTVRKYKE